jgi:hypothetical protein
MYLVAAQIEYWDTDAVGCFDPTKVILRLMDEIAEAVVCLHDYAWKDYDLFQSMGAHEGTLRTAESDALRRGPMYRFRLRTGNGQIILGLAERYEIKIWSKEEIPDDLRQRFLKFLRSLKLDPIEVKSVRIEGNDEYTA